MTPAALNTFDAWHKAVELGVHGSQVDSTAIENFSGCVHEKIKFNPPTYFKGWTGREEFVTIITAVGQVFGKSFKYHRQFVSPDGLDWGLEFSAEIGNSGKKMTGIDLVKLDEDGNIVDFTVLARPPNAVTELKNEMMKRVGPKMAILKAKQAASSLFG